MNWSVATDRANEQLLKCDNTSCQALSSYNILLIDFISMERNIFIVTDYHVYCNTVLLIIVINNLFMRKINLCFCVDPSVWIHPSGYERIHLTLVYVSDYHLSLLWCFNWMILQPVLIKLIGI